MTMRKIVPAVVLLYVLWKAVEVTAFSPQVQPLSPSWATQIAEHALRDVRWTIQKLAGLYGAWVDPAQADAQTEFILPPLAGLDQQSTVTLLDQLGAARADFQTVSADHCRQPGRVVTTSPAPGARIHVQDPVEVFICAQPAPAVAEDEVDLVPPTPRSRDADRDERSQERIPGTY